MTLENKRRRLPGPQAGGPSEGMQKLFPPRKPSAVPSAPNPSLLRDVLPYCGACRASWLECRQVERDLRSESRAIGLRGASSLDREESSLLRGQAQGLALAADRIADLFAKDTRR